MKRPGFGLIETLITFSLSVFFITATGQLLLQSLHLHQKSEAEVKTARLASSSLEYLRSLPFDHEELTAGDYEGWVAEPDTGERFRRRWRIEDISPETKQLEIEVSPASGRFHGLKLCLRLSRDLGF